MSHSIHICKVITLIKQKCKIYIPNDLICMKPIVYNRTIQELMFGANEYSPPLVFVNRIQHVTVVNID